MNDMEVEEVRLDLKFDTTHTWNPRERVIISAMDDYLAKRKFGDPGGNGSEQGWRWRSFGRKEEDQSGGVEDPGCSLE